jgi:hypothetical protein
VFLGFLAERLPNDVISVNNDVGHSYLEIEIENLNLLFISLLLMIQCYIPWDDENLK